MKKFLVLLLSGILFLGFSGLGLAGIGPGSSTRSITAHPQITNISSISEFVTQFASTSNFFHGSYWANNFLNILIYFLVPIIFLTVLLYAIMDEIGIFNKKIRFVLALLLAIMAIPAGVYSGLLAMMANLGGIFASVFFFAIVFILGLSFWYRKKAREYGFFMGNKFFTILVVYAPLIIMFTLAGIWLGGMQVGGSYLFNFATGATITTSIITILVVIAAIAALGLISKSMRSSWVGLILSLIVAGVVSVFLVTVAKTDVGKSTIMGAFLGFAVGLGFALLEWGRVYSFNIEGVLKAENERLKDLRKSIKELHEDIDHLRERIASENDPAVISSLNKQLIERSQQLESLNARLYEEQMYANKETIKKMWKK